MYESRLKSLSRKARGVVPVVFQHGGRRSDSTQSAAHKTCLEGQLAAPYESRDAKTRTKQNEKEKSVDIVRVY